MKLTTQMFITLISITALLASFQYVLLRLEKDRIKDYGASLGAAAAVSKNMGGQDFLGGIFKSKAKVKPERYNYANLYCSKNICSFSMKKKSLLMMPLTVTVDKDTLVKACLSQDTDMFQDICGDLKKAGWDIIRAEDK